MRFHTSGIAAPSGNFGATDFDGRLIAIEAIRVDSAAKWKALVNAAIYAGLKEVLDAKVSNLESTQSSIRSAEQLIPRGEQLIAQSGPLGLTQPPVNMFASLMSLLKTHRAPQTAAAVQRAAARFWREVEQPLQGKAAPAGKAKASSSSPPQEDNVLPPPPAQTPAEKLDAAITPYFLYAGIAVGVLTIAGITWAFWPSSKAD
jgi:hypothetical protein